MTTPVDMDTIRTNVVQRIVEKLTLAKWLRGIQQDYQQAMPRPVNPGRRSPNEDLAALMQSVDLNAHTIEDDIWSDIEQLAMLFARDVLAVAVRNHGEQEPVVMLTGNSMAPAFRNFDDIERIWQTDGSGVYIHELWERIEQKALSLSIFIGYPEYDNCIYGVDMTKWEQSEASIKDQPMESLNDEWSWIDPTPDTTSADETRGYVLKMTGMKEAVETRDGKEPIRFTLGQQVRFREPNTDIGIHTIVEIGRDSDNDVWVRLDSLGGQPIFEWAKILIPVN